MINLRKPMKNKLLKTRTLGLAMAAVLATGSFCANSAPITATATANLQVTATIAASCSIATTPVAFGTIPTNGSQVSTDGTINVTCSTGTVAVVTLDEGVNKLGYSSPSNPFRTMKHSSAASVIPYFLFSDNGNTDFGTNVGAQNTLIGTGAEQSINVHGTARVDEMMDFPVPGSYADTVVATVTY
jgi:spore coat protein U-like protein